MFGPNSYICRSYRRKTGWGSLFAPPLIPRILNRVNKALYSYKKKPCDFNATQRFKCKVHNLLCLSEAII